MVSVMYYDVVYYPTIMNTLYLRQKMSPKGKGFSSIGLFVFWSIGLKVKFAYKISRRLFIIYVLYLMKILYKTGYNSSQKKFRQVCRVSWRV